jgi:hypothetical protein
MSHLIYRNVTPYSFCHFTSGENTVAAAEDSADKMCGMKLRQNQVWKQGDEFLRIVVLERLEVRYKAVKNLATGEGKHHSVTKKEFCRLIKGATLLTPSGEIDSRVES